MRGKGKILLAWWCLSRLIGGTSSPLLAYCRAFWIWARRLWLPWAFLATSQDEWTRLWSQTVPQKCSFTLVGPHWWNLVCLSAATSPKTWYTSWEIGLQKSIVEILLSWGSHLHQCISFWCKDRESVFSWFLELLAFDYFQETFRNHSIWQVSHSFLLPETFQPKLKDLSGSDWTVSLRHKLYFL